MSNSYSPIALSPAEKLGSNLFTYYSNRMKRIIEVAGIFRYIDLLKLEMDHTVVFFCERPLGLPIIQDGKKSTILMDTFVEYENGAQELRQIDEYMNKATRERLRQWCDDNTVRFAGISNEHLSKEVKYFENLQYLYGCLTRSRINNEKALLSQLTSYLASNGGQVTIEEIEEADLFYAHRIIEILALAYSYGKVSIANIGTRVIDNKTGVSLWQPNQ